MDLHHAWRSDMRRRGIDHSQRSLDVSYVEGLIPKEFGADAVEVLGARSLLADLEEAKAPWAIVVRPFERSSTPSILKLLMEATVQTSGSRPLVTGWLDVMQLAHPRNMVTAEDVKRGKPGEQSANTYFTTLRVLN